MIIFVGGYIDEAIIAERKLPGPNPAGANRMLRLAMALAAVGEKVVIVSPASAMRMGWTGRLLHRRKIRHKCGIPIVYCPAVGVPVIGMLWEQIALPLQLLLIKRRKSLKSLIVYSFYPSYVVAAFFARFFLGVKSIVEDLEDVCVAKLSDWSPSSGERPVQQLGGWFMMQAMVWLAKSVIIPTRRFSPFLSSLKKQEVITGCMPVSDKLNSVCDRAGKIVVLYAGALETEHGIELLVQSLLALDNDVEVAARYRFEICGYGTKASWLEQATRSIVNLEVVIHGFVSDQCYNSLLERANVCLVLQSPHGRFASHKTPSKGYEFMGHGKAIIVANVGDFAELPAHTIIRLEPYSSEKLVEILTELSVDRLNTVGTAAHRHASENWALHSVGSRLQELL